MLDKQDTQRIVLISLISSIATAVPIAIIISLLIPAMNAPTTQNTDTIVTPTNSVVLTELEKQDDINTVETQEKEEFELEELVPNTQTSDTEYGRHILRRFHFSTNQAIYQLSSGTFLGGDDSNEQTLTRTDLSTGEDKIIIPDMKKLVKDRTLRELELLWIFSNPNNGDELILEIVAEGTENPGGDLYKFDINKRTLTKLDVSSKIAGQFNYPNLSPDNKKMTLIPTQGNDGDDKELHIIDLFKDSADLVLVLDAEETFNAGKEGLLASHDIEWRSNNIIRYAVYSQPEKAQDRNSEIQENTLIEYRELNLAENAVK